MRMWAKDSIAKTPPMGWNSWDCYGAAVNETQLLANAAYMKEHLLAYGWDTIVCDIQWSEPTAVSTEYHPFAPLCMDAYSRLIPAPNRFPSSAGGKGFGPIAAKVHGMGLKFGIHIMRGIPRQAVHQDTPLLGGDKARAIAQAYSVCPWNTDMYGVNPDHPNAQRYYDSLFALYAEWGVDFVKVDDIANTEFRKNAPYSAAREIEMIRLAMDRCGRPMVLSLSPGPAVIEKAWHLSRHANMWRMTGDMWDQWPQVRAMFERCEVWQAHVGEGCWPDCDMLPLGRLRCFDGGGEMSRLTQDEQRTLMSLWCIFRSPLMMGGNLPDNDAFTLSLLTNAQVLRLVTHGRGARQLARTEAFAIWVSDDVDGGLNVGLFNIADAAGRVTLPEEAIPAGVTKVLDLWTGEDHPFADQPLHRDLPAHGAALLRLT